MPGVSVGLRQRQILTRWMSAVPFVVGFLGFNVSGHVVKSAGFHFLLTSPEPTYGGVRLDTGRLAIEWLCVLVITGLGCLFSKARTAPAPYTRPSRAPPVSPAAGKLQAPFSHKEMGPESRALCSFVGHCRFSTTIAGANPART